MQPRGERDGMTEKEIRLLQEKKSYWAVMAIFFGVMGSGSSNFIGTSVFSLLLVILELGLSLTSFIMFVLIHSRLCKSLGKS